MTDTPSDAAIEEALRRQGLDGCITVPQVRTGDTTADRLTLAHAKTLQEVSDALEGYWGSVAKIPDRFSPFIIPPPDPDEELARAFHDAYEMLAPGFGYYTREDTRQFDPQSPNGKLMLATIKRLREQGRLTDAK